MQMWVVIYIVGIAKVTMSDFVGASEMWGNNS